MPNINLLSSHEATFTNPHNIPLKEKSIIAIFVLKHRCVYMNICMYTMYVQELMEARKGCWISCNRCYRQLWAA